MKSIERAPDLRRQVYERLRESLRSGQLSADMRLMEHGVARDYGVSRTPAREALAMLAQEGLLVQDGRGFRLPRYSEDEIRDVYEVRQTLEPVAVRRVLETATAEQCAAVRALIERELDEHGDHDSYIGANARIREAIFHLCPNEKLQQVVHLFEEMTQYIRLKTLTMPDVRALSVAGMRKLARAIGDRDADAAEAAMNELLTTARQEMLSVMADGPPPIP